MDHVAAHLLSTELEGTCQLQHIFIGPVFASVSFADTQYDKLCMPVRVGLPGQPFLCHEACSNAHCTSVAMTGAGFTQHVIPACHGQ